MDAVKILGAVAMFSIGAVHPPNAEAFQCVGGIPGVDTRMLCSGVFGDTNLSTSPSTVKSWDMSVENPGADGVLLRSNTDALKGYLSSVSTKAQTDYGVNRAFVETTLTGPDSMITTVNPANGGAAQSLWSDTLSVTGAPGQQVTLNGHVHAKFGSGDDYYTNTGFPIGFQRLYYQIGGYSGAGVLVENFAFGNSSIFEVNGSDITGEVFQPFSIKLTLLGSSGAIFLQSNLYVAAGGNRDIDAFGTAAIDFISAPLGVTLATASNSLTQTDGGYRFTASVPEPSAYVLMLLGLAVLTMSAGRREVSAPLTS